ncbi:MAG: preprotein translocase subunit SecG [Phycisphaerales bacterium]|nr:preprotein translocase subunit SecG [Phycisphaerales bacterium]
MDSTLGMLTLGAATWVIGLLSVGFLFCSILLILTVLIQRPQGGGLSGAFGAGAGSGETAFGARTGDALTIATISFFVLWLVVAVGLVWVMQPPGPGSARPQATSTEQAPPPTGGAAPAEGSADGATPATGETPAGGQSPSGETAPAGDQVPAGDSAPAGAPTDAPDAPADGGAGEGGGR